MRKLILIAMPVLFAVHLLTWLLPWLRVEVDDGTYYSLRLVSYTFVAFPMGVMFSRGTFRRIWWCRLGYFAVAAVIMGMMFKLQHWPGAEMLLLCGGFSICIIYLIHFMLKRDKTLLDWLKLAYAELVPLTMFFIFWHLPGATFVKAVLYAATLALIACFYFLTLKQKEE